MAKSKTAVIRPGLAGLVLALVAGCATQPREVPRMETHAMTGTENTTLGKAAAESVAGSGESAFYPLARGAEAFAARVGLVRAAERSLDVQYYIWHPDSTGNALLGELLRAANRGVRVRLLLDDIHTEGMDAVLAALDAHPNFEIHIYNPFHRRSQRWADFIFDYRRVNRRMHNKSLTADNQYTIVGGRNVGDEYFAANPEMDFSDLDAIAAGPVVPEVSAEFDSYWNSPVSVPLAALIAPLDDAAVKAEYARLEQEIQKESQSEYAQSLLQLELVRAVKEKRLEVFRGNCRVIADPPDKVLQPVAESAHAILELSDIMAASKQEVLLVSPYFVPGSKGTEALAGYPKRGVKLRILTNSYLATDVGPVHSGYMPYRKKLLEAGVEIYELKRSARAEAAEGKEKKDSGGAGSSGASLHAKTYLMDRKTVFIGSLNLDPRSAHINTEMGLVVESPDFATRFCEKFDEKVLDAAYRVELRKSDGKMTWTTRENGQEVTVDSEPGIGPLKSFSLFIMRVLPVEEQL